MRPSSSKVAVEGGRALVFLGALGGGLHLAGFLVPVVEPALVFGELAGFHVHEQRRDRVLRHERAVVLFALDDLARHAQGKRGVGTGLDRDEPVGIAGRCVEQQADVDDLGAAALGLDDVLGHALLVLDGVAAPDDEIGRGVELDGVDHHVLVEVAQVEIRCVVGTVVQAICVQRVGAAPQAAQAVAEQRVEALRRRKRRGDVPERDGVRAVFLAQLEHLRADLVERLVPADALPLAFAALAGALQRVQQAVFRVHLTPRRDALLAAVALSRFGARVVHGFRAHDLAVFHDGLDGAELVVAPAGTGRADPFLL